MRREIMNTRRSSASRHGLVAILMLTVTAAPGLAADAVAPPQRRAERLHFDPAQNRWVEAPTPVPGTADGDLDIARQWMALEDYSTALKAIRGWIQTYGPQETRYPEALYLEGMAYLGLGDYRAANDSFQALLNDFPGSEYAERALSGMFRVGEQYLAGKRRKAMKGLFKVKDEEAGIKIMDDVIVNYRDTPLAEQAQLTKADYYYETGEFELAEEEYARFAREFTRSRYQPKALLWSAYSALAAFPGILFDDASLIEAQERFRQFLASYPAQAQQMEVPTLLDQIAATRADKTYEIGWFYERTKQRAAARYYYRETIARWPDTPGAAQAQGRLAALGEPEG